VFGLDWLFPGACFGSCIRIVQHATTSHYPLPTNGIFRQKKPFTMSEKKPLIKNQSNDEVEHLRRLKAYQP
jgi:hypothetical protein